MHLVKDTHTPRWETVASVGLQGIDEGTAENNTLPGALEVQCLRTPRTDLSSARFAVVLEDVKAEQITRVEVTQGELYRLALGLLEAAQHGIPVELSRAGYEHAVMPWFEGEPPHGGGAA